MIPPGTDLDDDALAGDGRPRYQPPGDVLMKALGNRADAAAALDALRRAGWRLNFDPRCRCGGGA